MINALTGIPLREIIREIRLFVAVLIATLLLMALVPDPVLRLPRALEYVK